MPEIAESGCMVRVEVMEDLSAARKKQKYINFVFRKKKKSPMFNKGGVCGSMY